MDSKQSLKTGDDGINKIRKMMEKWQNRMTLDNLRLCERYLNGDVVLFIIVIPAGELSLGHPSEYCAIFQNVDSLSRLEGIENGWVDLRDGNSPAPTNPVFRQGNVAPPAGSADHEQTMLVNNVEMMDQPEIVVSSLIRVQSVDHAFRDRADSLYLSQKVGFIFGRSVKNRELNPSRDVAVRLNELPNEMVEGAPQIVDSIPDDAGEIIGDSPVAINSDLLDFVSGLRIILADDEVGVGLAEGVNAGFKITDVILGPFDFKSDS